MSRLRSGELFDWLRSGITPSDAVSELTSMPSDERAGNCHEYCMIAIDYGVKYHMPNIWLAEHDLHEFLLIADFHDHSPISLYLNQFDQYLTSKDHAFWVCDPWFNIVCDMTSYAANTKVKAHEWVNIGKEITQANRRIPANVWAMQLYLGPIMLTRMTDNSGNPTELYNDYWISYLSSSDSSSDSSSGSDYSSDSDSN